MWANLVTIDVVGGAERLWVIIPVYNEERRLGACLDAMAIQDDQNFTLCVVDNNSCDATSDIANRFSTGAHFPVVVLTENDKGVGSAVDTGFRYAIRHGATMLARTDADTIPDPDWTVEVKRALQGGAELAIGAMTARRDEHGAMSRVAFRAAVILAGCFGRIRPAHRRDGSRYQMHAGFNMAIRPELYERCGGMPRRPSPTDREFMNRVRAVGGVVRRCSKMRAGTSLRRFSALGVAGTARWYLDRGAHTEDPR